MNSSSRRQTITKEDLRLILNERKRELNNLQKTEDLTNKLSATLLNLDKQLQSVGGQRGIAGEVSVTTQNWVQIVRAISLAANSMSLYSKEDFKNAEMSEQEVDYNPLVQFNRPVTERLVRCQVQNGVIVDDQTENKS